VISIVIPIYRGEEVIRDCLTSVNAAAESLDIEAVAVDDCSPDRSAEIVGSEFADVILISNESNRGYAYAVNRGIERARGDLILLLNQDTVLLPGSLRILSETLEEDESISAVAPQLVFPSGEIQPSCRMLPRHTDVVYHHMLLSYLMPQSKLFGRWKMRWFDHQSRMEVEQPSFSAILVRKSVFDQIGLLDESFDIFFNDVDFCNRMNDRGMRVVFEPSAKVRHLLGQATSKEPMRKIVNSHRNFVRYFFEHFRGGVWLLPNLAVVLMLAVSGIVRLVWHLIRRPFT